MLGKEKLRKLLSPKLFYILVDIKNKIIANDSYKKQIAINAKMTQFYRLFINKNDLVFDIGANYGNRIKPFIKLGARIIAVEPQKICTDFLKSMYGKKIKIVQKGIGAFEGYLEFYKSKNTALSTFSNTWIKKVKSTGRFENFDWTEPEKVPITTLENLIMEFGQPEFIKIDVEGFEFEVLSTLNFPIKNLSFEYAVPENLDSLIKIIQLLNTLENYNFNYCIEETMEFQLKKWLNSEDFLEHIKSNIFIETYAGDVYVSLVKK